MTPTNLTKGLLLVLLLGFAAAQFVRPEKNRSADPLGPASLVATLEAPPEIRALLATSCNDCHSDETRYPWYAEVQPAGWLLARHVRDGKTALNLSSFGNLSKQAQKRRLGFMIDAVAAREMPLRSYTWLHRDAILSAAQIQAFTAWAEAAIVRLEKEASASPGGS